MNYRYGPIKIVIADDHELFRDGFKLLLKNQQEIILAGEAENGKQLIELVTIVQPDVVIVDIKMPVMDGIEACASIHQRFPSIQLIALSMFNDDNLIVDMLEAGARGYLLKNTNKEELLLAVRTVYEGHTFYCPTTSMKLSKMIAESKFNPHRNFPAKKFTRREIEVIQLICEEKTNKEIAHALHLSIRTIESHREKIQEKTGARNSVGVAIYAIRHKLYVV